MKTLQLKPAPGRDCPMPEDGGALLPEKGAKVPHNAYWQRRLNDGDAVVVGAKSDGSAVVAATKPARGGKS